MMRTNRQIQRPVLSVRYSRSGTAAQMANQDEAVDIDGVSPLGAIVP
jgi:hypothetical protein